MSDTSTNVETNQSGDLDDKISLDTIDNNATKLSSESLDSKKIILSSSSTQTEEESSSEKRHHNILDKMYYVFRQLLCCLIAVVLTSYAAYHSGQPKISTPPLARPFFPEGSLVTDWFRGEIGPAILRSMEHDISFIMYYAPWDAESQLVRKEFDIAANFYYKQVHFAAVNCWQPQGECAFEKIRENIGVRSWPGLVAHRGQKGIIYRGPTTAAYLIRFLKNLINPLNRITSTHDLVNLVQRHDAIIYGTVDNSIHYNTFYKTALKLLELDPMREIAVAVSTSVLLENNVVTPSLQLITANGTIVNTGKNWTVTNLVNWTLKHLHRPLAWTSIPGLGKSNLLSSFIKSNPTLLVFTPRNPFLEYNYNYQMVRFLALQYYNCENHQNDEYFINAVQFGLRKKQQEIKHIYNQCVLDGLIVDQPKQKSMFTSWTNHKNCAKTSSIMSNFNTCLDNDLILENTPNYCWVDKFKKHENVKKIQNNIEKHFNGDLLSAEHLMMLQKIDKCRFLHGAKQFFGTFSKPEKNISKSKLINGLSCKSNSTLAITVIDSLRYVPLANALGIDVSINPEKTVAVIIDAAKESHFIMEKPLMYENLIQFIVNYSQNNLEYSTRSKFEPTFSPSHYTAQNKSTCVLNKNSICLVELTTDTFIPTVMETGKAFVVLYYSSHCGFCIDASRVFLLLAKIFEPLSFLKFVRIDGEKHTLPWHFNMPQYPTILFFPARRKAESRAFPQAAVRSVSNLVTFILANLESPLNLHALWLLCSKSKILNDLNQCTSQLRMESIKLMKRSLREWRHLKNTTSHYARGVLRRVKYLRSLNLLLGTIDLSKFISVKNILNRLQTTPWSYESNS